MVNINNEVLIGGLQKDFSDALARRLNANPVYVVLPRKRLEIALDNGEADLLCDMRPEWFGGKSWLWSESTYSNSTIVVSLIDIPPIEKLSDLAGRPVGTILGYHYPELESALGPKFIRDDATSNSLNLKKLLMRRYQYLVSSTLFFDYQRKVHEHRDQLNPARFNLFAFDAYCALPAHGKFSLTQINNAIAALKKDDEINAILRRYRAK